MVRNLWELTDIETCNTESLKWEMGWNYHKNKIVKHQYNRRKFHEEMLAYKKQWITKSTWHFHVLGKELCV